MATFERFERIKMLDRVATPLMLGGGYDISSGATRLAWCAGVSLFFWTPLWGQMTRGLREVIRCSSREQLTIASGSNLKSILATSCLFYSSLQMLGTDYFDIWLALWVKHENRFGKDVLNWVTKQKKAGRIKLFGISTHRHDIAKKALNLPEIDVLMLRYNAAHRYYDNFLVENSHLIRDKLIVSYTSTKWGYLIRRDEGWPSDSDVPCAADCYAFALDNPSIDIVLFGPKNLEELESSFEFFKYSAEHWQTRKTLLEKYGQFIYAVYGKDNSYKLRKKWGILPR